MLYILAFKGKEAIRFADSLSLIQKNEAAILRFRTETSICILTCSVIVFQQRIDSSSKLYTILLITNLLENLTAIHFQLASGILGKCVWIFQLLFKQNVAFPGGSVVKNPPASAGDVGSVPESGRSPGEGNGNPLQYSCLENPMDRVVWWAGVHEVAKELDI